MDLTWRREDENEDDEIEFQASPSLLQFLNPDIPMEYLIEDVEEE